MDSKGSAFGGVPRGRAPWPCFLKTLTMDLHMTSLPALLLVGGGCMGSAMLSGWRERGLSTAVVVDPSPEAAKLAGQGVTVVQSVADIPGGFVPQAVILAVKPQSAG